MNASLLYPLTGNQGVIYGDTMSIPIVLGIKPIADNIIDTLSFEAMLGDSASTVITLTDLVVNSNSSAKVQIVPGVFSLLGVCYQGGARLIIPKGKVQILAVLPNPAEDNIEVDFETIEAGTTRLYLTNVLGEEVREFSNGELPTGVHAMSFSVSGIMIGNYFLVMQTPSQRLVSGLIISK